LQNRLDAGHWLWAVHFSHLPALQNGVSPEQSEASLQPVGLGGEGVPNKTNPKKTKRPATLAAPRTRSPITTGCMKKSKLFFFKVP
jgi:hypothetical protein